MKKYYLVAEKRPYGDSTHYGVFVSDVSKGRIVLMEIEAESYLEAVRQVSFHVHGAGNDAYCGLGPDGKAYSETL